MHPKCVSWILFLYYPVTYHAYENTTLCNNDHIFWASTNRNLVFFMYTQIDKTYSKTRSSGKN
jgi:hypothetical protein